ncbi:helix-turn-helix transcriptional regulator [Flavitalea sp. BT771]|uniref:helix-turn-helix domain-containing protein n=1 Tax=Flavitalea sp. BT771 TaxID=3063329 RepID=UPI0026E329E7|nr:helix-turn-helix transcriptional regulator [Flavitalea sp. BT771]MDO6433448.1 helix-turn-helix transcriptional regulator [Flavitalea sp. BT771]MDV6222647.1 helix-turn-helix transcriptional regulator [Flavitalea sp. BT771]
MLGLPKPLHPLVSLVDNTKIAVDKDKLPAAFLFNFYKISYKTVLRGKIRYGQNYYDFDEGGLVFTAPNQVLAITDDTEYLGSTLLFHPDFIRNYPLGENIKKFGFFSYDTHEALHLSEKEKAVILNIFRNMEDELQSTIDDFSQDVIIAQIELLLNYSNRFYKRQFLTRKAVNSDLLSQLEHLLDDYFDKESALTKGLPTVQYLAEQLHVSPRYLSDMLRSLTGQNAQQHIHHKLIEKAKVMLSTSNLSVAEVAYQLGFEYPQSFNKLFKRKTSLSPLEFRESFN